MGWILLLLLVIAVVVIIIALGRKPQRGTAAETHGRHNPTAQRTPSSTPRVTSEEDPEKAAFAEAQASVNHTLGALVDLRLKVALLPLSENATKLLDEIIDHLWILLPIFKAQFMKNELTFVVEQIATRYVPDLIRPYLAMDEATRTAKAAELEKGLASVATELTSVRTLAQSRQANEFETQAKFLRMKFLGETQRT